MRQNQWLSNIIDTVSSGHWKRDKEILNIVGTKLMRSLYVTENSLRKVRLILRGSWQFLDGVWYVRKYLFFRVALRVADSPLACTDYIAITHCVYLYIIWKQILCKMWFKLSLFHPTTPSLDIWLTSSERYKPYKQWQFFLHVFSISYQPMQGSFHQQMQCECMQYLQISYIGPRLWLGVCCHEPRLSPPDMFCMYIP